ncbi:MAG: hypothetical protein ACRC6U_04260 [Fusobacteriaceae bacterium]
MFMFIQFKTHPTNKNLKYIKKTSGDYIVVLFYNKWRKEYSFDFQNTNNFKESKKYGGKLTNYPKEIQDWTATVSKFVKEKFEATEKI